MKTAREKLNQIKANPGTSIDKQKTKQKKLRKLKKKKDKTSQNTKNKDDRKEKKRPGNQRAMQT